MEKFDNVIAEIIDKLFEIEYSGDLSDVGNEIGIVLGKHMKEGEPGWSVDDFIHGIKHGMSLTDDTH